MKFSKGLKRLHDCGLDVAKLVLESADTGVWLWNVQTGEVVVNEKWVAIIGYTLDELEPINIETWLEHAYEDDLSKSTALLNEHFEGGSEYYQCSVRMHHKQGHLVKILDTGQLITRTAQGEPEWAFGIHVDITQQWLKEQQIAELKDKLEQFTHSLPGFVYQFKIDKNGKWSFPFASKKVEDLYGCTVEQVQSDASCLFDILHPEDIDGLYQSIERSRQDLNVWSYRYRVCHPTKGILWLEGNSHPLESEDGSVVWNGFTRDVTKEVAQNEQVKLLSAVYSVTRQGIIITDANTRIVDVNPAFEHITGLSKEQLIGQIPDIFDAQVHSEAQRTQMWQTLAQKGHWQGEVWIKRKAQAPYAQMLTIDALYNDKQQITHFIGAYSDISQMMAKQQLLAQMVNQDPLTGIANRRALMVHLEQAIESADKNDGSFVLVYLDLDNFKVVNDTLGHAQGDEFLIELADALGHVVRENDLVARIGGDEFVVVMPMLQAEEAIESRCKQFAGVVNDVAKRFVTDPLVGTSFGVALYPQDASGADQLMSCADGKMYRMKYQHREQKIAMRS